LATRTVRGTMQGPPANLILGHIPAFRAAPLEFLASAVERYGDIVRLRAGFRPTILIRHPDHLQHVLQAHHAQYPKRTAVLDRVGRVLGQGLVNSEGALWRAQRRRLQPFFTAEAIGEYVPAMVDEASRVAARWVKADGTQVDVASEMMALTFRIAGQALFGFDLEEDVHDIRESVATLEAHSNPGSRRKTRSASDVRPETKSSRCSWRVTRTRGTPWLGCGISSPRDPMSSGVSGKSSVTCRTSDLSVSATCSPSGIHRPWLRKLSGSTQPRG